ncbi:multidrug ABC transporter ATPase [Solibacillus sp. FSL K6-1523]|uniref:multidrug ABC transporter ATPase n=1 Tax=Solibacillus sp. FSL K6-1523 TaxID=2921471 RepID=UPI0030F8A5BD
MKNQDDIVNGNMANTLEELKMLGKQMEHMRDEQQLEEHNRIPDPQQFDNEEKTEEK